MAAAFAPLARVAVVSLGLLPRFKVPAPAVPVPLKTPTVTLAAVAPLWIFKVWAPVLATFCKFTVWAARLFPRVMVPVVAVPPRSYVPEVSPAASWKLPVVIEGPYEKAEAATPSSVKFPSALIVAVPKVKAAFAPVALLINRAKAKIRVEMVEKRLILKIFLYFIFHLNILNFLTMIFLSSF
jgi:hypothetical protein